MNVSNRGSRKCDEVSLSWLIASPTASPETIEETRSEYASNKCPFQALTQDQSPRALALLRGQYVKALNEVFSGLINQAAKAAEILNQEYQYQKSLSSAESQKEEANALMYLWQHAAWINDDVAQRLYEPLYVYANLAYAAREQQMTLACVRESWQRYSQEPTQGGCSLSITAGCEDLLRAAGQNAKEKIVGMTERSIALCLQKECSQDLQKMEQSRTTDSAREKDCAIMQQNASLSCQLAGEANIPRNFVSDEEIHNAVGGALDLSGDVCRSRVPAMMQASNPDAIKEADDLVKGSSALPASSYPTGADAALLAKKRKWASKLQPRADAIISESTRHRALKWKAFSQPKAASKVMTRLFTRPLAYVTDSMQSLSFGPKALAANSDLLSQASVRVLLSVLVTILPDSQTQANLSVELVRRIIWESYGHDAGGLVPNIAKDTPSDKLTASQQLASDNSKGYIKTKINAIYGLKAFGDEILAVKEDINARNTGVGVAASVMTAFFKHKAKNYVPAVLARLVLSTLQDPREMARSLNEAREDATFFCSAVVPPFHFLPFEPLVRRVELGTDAHNNEKNSARHTMGVYGTGMDVKNFGDQQTTTMGTQDSALQGMAALTKSAVTGQRETGVLDQEWARKLSDVHQGRRTWAGLAANELHERMTNHGSQATLAFLGLGSATNRLSEYKAILENPKLLPPGQLLLILETLESHWKPGIIAILTFVTAHILECIRQHPGDTYKIRDKYERLLGHQDAVPELKELEALRDNEEELRRLVEAGTKDPNNLVGQTYNYAMGVARFAFMRGALSRKESTIQAKENAITIQVPKQEPSLDAACREAAASVLVQDEHSAAVISAEWKKLVTNTQASQEMGQTHAQNLTIDSAIRHLESLDMESALEQFGQIVWSVAKEYTKQVIAGSPAKEQADDNDGGFHIALAYTANQMLVFCRSTAGRGLQKLALESNVCSEKFNGQMELSQEITKRVREGNMRMTEERAKQLQAASRLSPLRKITQSVSNALGFSQESAGDHGSHATPGEDTEAAHPIVQAWNDLPESWKNAAKGTAAVAATAALTYGVKKGIGKLVSQGEDTPQVEQRLVEAMHSDDPVGEAARVLTQSALPSAVKAQLSHLMEDRVEAYTKELGAQAKQAARQGDAEHTRALLAAYTKGLQAGQGGTHTGTYEQEKAILEAYAKGLKAAEGTHHKAQPGIMGSPQGGTHVIHHVLPNGFAQPGLHQATTLPYVLPASYNHGGAVILPHVHGGQVIVPHPQGGHMVVQPFMGQGAPLATAHLQAQIQQERQPNAETAEKGGWVASGLRMAKESGVANMVKKHIVGLVSGERGMEPGKDEDSFRDEEDTPQGVPPSEARPPSRADRDHFGSPSAQNAQREPDTAQRRQRTASPENRVFADMPKWDLRNRKK